MDQSVINFKIYEDGTEYYGMANVQMPTLSNMTQTLTGAGVSGEIGCVTATMNEYEFEKAAGKDRRTVRRDGRVHSRADHEVTS